MDADINIGKNTICELAVAIWEIKKRIELLFDGKEVPVKLRDPISRQYSFLRNSGIEIHDLTGKQYNDGLSVEIVSYDCDPKILKEGAIIQEMVEPIVTYKNMLLERGKVILGRCKYENQ